MSILSNNTGTTFVGGNKVKIVSLLNANATPANSPKIIGGNVRSQMILADPLTGAPLDLQADTATAAQTAAGGTGKLVPDAVGNILLPSGQPLMTQKQAVKWALFGDSREAMNHHLITGFTLSRTGGIATVVATAHGLPSRRRIRVFGIHEDTTFNAASVYMTRVDANTFTYPSPGPDVSVFTPNVIFARVLVYTMRANISPFQYANGHTKLRGAMSFLANFGQSSEQTPDMVARLAEVLASGADWVMYSGGVNDTAGTGAAAALPAATTIANDVTIVEAILDAGMNVMLATIDPLGSTHSALATATPLIVQINDARRDLCRSSKYHGRVQLLDAWEATVDPGHVYARAGALNSSDQVHRQPYGAILIGNKWANSMPWQALGHVLSASVAQARVQYATSRNLYPVGQWALASGGTLGSGVTNGTPATGELAGVQVGSAVTITGGAATVVIRPDLDENGNIVGYLQVAQVTPSAAGTVTIAIADTSAMLTVNSIATAAGNKIRPALRLKTNGIAGAGANIEYPRVRCNGTFTGASGSEPGSVTLNMGTPLHSDAPAQTADWNIDIDLWMHGEDYEIPPFTTFTAFNFEVIVAWAGSASLFEVCVGRITVDQVS